MYYSQSCAYIISSFYQTYQEELLLFPFYKLINWGAEEQEISKVIQLLSSKQAIWWPRES